MPAAHRRLTVNVRIEVVVVELGKEVLELVNVPEEDFDAVFTQDLIGVFIHFRGAASTQLPAFCVVHHFIHK